MSIASSLYLATESGNTGMASSRILDKTNLARVTWSIDWDTIFHGKNGLCKVSMNMISKKGATPSTWNGGVGSITASFSSPYSLNNNGLPISQLQRNQYIEVDAASNIGYVYYFSGDTTKNSVLPVINIPQGKSSFTIQMLDTTLNTMTNFPEYSVFLNFEWLDNKNSFSNI